VTDDDGDVLYCAANDNGVGEEYNPLKEFGKYGGANPY